MSDTFGRGFGYCLSIFANLAVVAGIVFLGVEIRQNSEMMKAQIRNDITQNIFANADRSMRPDVIAAQLRQRNREELLPEDEIVLDMMVRSGLRSFENSRYQYSIGLFDEAEYRGIVSFFESILDDPFAVKFWNENRDQFSEGFWPVVDSLIDANR
jgi:hypothetical protein